MTVFTKQTRMLAWARDDTSTAHATARGRKLPTDQRIDQRGGRAVPAPQAKARCGHRWHLEATAQDSALTGARLGLLGSHHCHGPGPQAMGPWAQRQALVEPLGQLSTTATLPTLDDPGSRDAGLVLADP